MGKSTAKEANTQMAKEEDRRRRITGKDAVNEGRDDAMMDIDRMVNEGMAGGRGARGQIEEATPIPPEEK